MAYKRLTPARLRVAVVAILFIEALVSLAVWNWLGRMAAARGGQFATAQ